MRISLLLVGVAVGVGGMSASAQAACNIRGEFCGYPSWAANAFSDPFDRVPNAWLDHPTNPPAYRYVNRDRTKTRYRKRYRDYR